MQNIFGKIRCIISIVKLPYHHFFTILLVNCCFIWSIHSWRWGGRGGSGRWLFYPRCQIKRGRTWCRWTMLNNQTTKQNPSVYYAVYKKPASRSLWKLQVNEIQFRFKIKTTKYMFVHVLARLAFLRFSRLAKRRRKRLLPRLFYYYRLKWTSVSYWLAVQV